VTCFADIGSRLKWQDSRDVRRENYSVVRKSATPRAALSY